MTKLKMTAAQMVSDARARVEEIETADLIGMVNDPNVVIVDIRDVRERHRHGWARRNPTLRWWADTSWGRVAMRPSCRAR